MDEKLLANGGDKPKGHYALTNDVANHQLGMFDKPLPYFGLGIGWFCLLVGFIFPVMWYFATILYFCNYYQRDPRERAGLAASAIAALICTFAVVIALAVILL